MLYLAKLLRGEPQISSHQQCPQCPLVSVETQPVISTIVRAVVRTINRLGLNATLLGMALFVTLPAMALPNTTTTTTTNIITDATTVPVNAALVSNVNSTPNLSPNPNPNPNQTANQNLTATALGDDAQVAPPPTTPFVDIDAHNNLPANQVSATTTNPMPAATSLAHTMQPSTEALSAANQKLLSQNAQLQRDVNDLSTQVNVLINERSGQLFMYGAITVVVALVLGFLLGAFIFSRRDRW